MGLSVIDKSTFSIRAHTDRSLKQFTLIFEITDTEGIYTETWIFEIVKEDGFWKIDNWKT